MSAPDQPAQEGSLDGGRSQFSRDVWWNVGGLGVAGVLGILLNYLVSEVYGVDALGVFNQVYAVYILFSQFAALGFHYSVLRHVAATGDARERRVVTTSALLATMVIAAVFAGALWLLAEPVGMLLGSADVGRGIRHAAPGVLFFALSKVTLGCLNALPRMRWYAVLFGGRFVLMVAAFAGCALLGVDHAVLPVILSLAEAATFLLSLVPAAGQLGRVARDELRRWVRAHLSFGVRGFMSGLLAELNTRVDVLILGIFAADSVVGAYSFAAILAEGVYQLLVVLRTNYAPVVIRLWSEGRAFELADLIRRARNRIGLASLGFGALAVVGYALVVPLITSDPALHESWTYFAALIAGMALSAGYAPFQPLLLYAGLPGWHTWLMIGIVGVNAAANFVFIAMIGPLGSALGTALAFLLGVVLLRVLARRLLQLRI
jgi:O-antigen/teichoic acid export membrane protein